jgi:hypothetical protein
MRAAFVGGRVLRDAGAHVGAAAADIEQHVRAELVADPAEALGRAAVGAPA